MPGIQFIKDFDPDLYETFDPRVCNLVVLDDQMENKAVHKRGGNAVTKYFTQGMLVHVSCDSVLKHHQTLKHAAPEGPCACFMLMHLQRSGA